MLSRQRRFDHLDLERGAPGDAVRRFRAGVTAVVDEQDDSERAARQRQGVRVRLFSQGFKKRR
jgi:hypothetical protein